MLTNFLFSCDDNGGTGSGGNTKGEFLLDIPPDGSTGAGINCFDNDDININQTNVNINGNGLDDCISAQENCSVVINASRIVMTNCERCIDAEDLAKVKMTAGDITCNALEV